MSVPNRAYVGNMPYNAGNSEDELRALFEQYGTVTEVKFINDREFDPPKFKGFCFVTMSSEEELVSAIEGLNDQDFLGRPLRVDRARPRESRPVGGGRH